MSRRTTGYSFGSLRPGDRVEVFRTEWLEAKVDSVVDSSVRLIFLEQGLSKRKTLHVHDDNLHIPSAISPPHVAVSPRFRPPFLEVDVTDEMQQLQRSSPTKWAMTLAHWNQFIDFCKGTPVWKELKNQKTNVNLYDMNKHFTIPFTRGSGCSVAVLMNKDTHVEAKVMLCHSWAEDMEECQKAVNIHFDSNQISQDTAVWFCGFALYQPEDGHGPTIQQQLELNPFTTVITSEFVQNGGKMIAVHTTTADLYERLWCVREVDEAIARRINMGAAFSEKYEEKVSKQYQMAIAAGASHRDALECAGLVVHAASAKCRDEDKAMLLKEIFSRGSLERIDAVVSKFQQAHVSPVIDKSMREAAMQGKQSETQAFPLSWVGQSRPE